MLVYSFDDEVLLVSRNTIFDISFKSGQMSKKCYSLYVDQRHFIVLNVFCKIIERHSKVPVLLEVELCSCHELLRFNCSFRIEKCDLTFIKLFYRE